MLVPRSLLFCALLAPILGSPALAEVLTVGLPGSGADFTTIDLAVAASGPDDTVFVQPGDYDFGILLIQKGARIVGAGSDQVFLRPTPAQGVSLPVIYVVQTLADQPVHISGMTIVAEGLGEQAAAAVPFQGCFAPVTLEDLVILHNEPGSASGSGEARMLILYSCSSVLLSNCQISGPQFDELDGGFGLGLLPVVRVEDCDMVFDSCVLTAGDNSSGLDPWKAGSSAIVAERSKLRLSGSTLIAGDGSERLLGFPTPGGPGVLLVDSDLTVGAGSSIAGGDGDTGVAGSSLGAPAIEARGTSSVALDPSAVLDPGSDGSGTIVEAEVELESGATLALLSRVATAVSTSLSGALAQVSLTVELLGDTGTVFVPGLSLEGATPLALPGLGGQLWLPLDNVVVLPAVTGDAQGMAQQAVGAALAAPFAGRPVLVQAFALDPLTGEAEISSPSVATLPVE